MPDTKKPRKPWGGTRLRVAVAASVLALSVSAPAAYAALDEGAPSSAPPKTVAERGKAYVETRLYFGTADPDGGPAVTDRQFRAFVDKHVTPRFPEGLTIQNGRGQWKDKQGTIERERSYELTVMYPESEAPTHDGDIQRIRSAYKRLFNQESVLRADDTARVGF
ncbi:DUF3574 domain-containing protein [Streptomyces sp. NPDC048172]|uniref:DUF3574 domain-containing protein n=1 Tax=Streptomyces sp. NPDC048172 TaxID=3365505 RepID=UPI003712D364